MKRNRKETTGREDKRMELERHPRAVMGRATTQHKTAQLNRIEQEKIPSGQKDQ